jgi:hypothetical protein
MLYDDLVQPGEYICHHGIKGQKWGVRRYQNEDGSLTEEGAKRYKKDLAKAINTRSPYKLFKLLQPIEKNLKKEYSDYYLSRDNLKKQGKKANDELNYFLMKKIYNFNKTKVDMMSRDERVKYTSSIDYLRAGFENRDKFFNTKDYKDAYKKFIDNRDILYKRIHEETKKYLGNISDQPVEGIPMAIKVDTNSKNTSNPSYAEYLSAILEDKASRT